MKLDPQLSQADWQARLTRAAAETWGNDRAAADQPMIETLSAALWQLAQQPLGFFDEEPDFIGTSE